MKSKLGIKKKIIPVLCDINFFYKLEEIFKILSNIFNMNAPLWINLSIFIFLNMLKARFFLFVFF